jgi:hypothetical protein
MQDGATKAFEQAYNAQVAVDSQAQVSVAAAVTQEATDKQQLVPMLRAVQDKVGQLPEKASADTGFLSAANLTAKALAGVALDVPPERPSPTPPDAVAPAAASPEGSVREQMRHELRTPEGQTVYKMRKAIVEPGLGQSKEGRGLRRFLFRGLAQVAAEGTLICLPHHLLKLCRGRTGLLAA